MVASLAVDKVSVDCCVEICVELTVDEEGNEVSDEVVVENAVVCVEEVSSAEVV